MLSDALPPAYPVPGLRPHAYLEVLLFGEFRGVAQQVGDNLAQPDRITCPMKPIRNRLIHPETEFNKTAFDDRSDRLGALLDYRSHINLSEVQRQSVSLNLGKVENVVD